MIFGVRRWPVFATLVVLAAAAVMVMLGFWQLGRLEDKEALIAHHRAAVAQSQAIAELNADLARESLYRRASLNCMEVKEWNAIAGRNARDAAGYVHVARCDVAEWHADGGPGFDAEIVVGWSRGPARPQWTGGAVTGTIARGGELGWRLVADPPLAGLEANAIPNPGDLPNNHLAYAVQWFFFAITALVIYVLALRRRER